MATYTAREGNSNPVKTPKGGRKKPKSVSLVGGGQGGTMTGMGTGGDR